MDFSDKIRLRGQAAEDLFFAELDRQLIKAMHEHEKTDDQEDSMKSDAKSDADVNSSGVGNR